MDSSWKLRTDCGFLPMFGQNMDVRSIAGINNERSFKSILPVIKDYIIDSTPITRKGFFVNCLGF